MYGCVTTEIWPPLSEVGGGGENCCFFDELIEERDK
jgi:hypothetical protein